MSSERIKRPSVWALLLLVIASLTCIATSPEHQDFASFAQWTSPDVLGDSTRFVLEVAPVGNRAMLANNVGDIFLTMKSGRVPADLADDYYWQLFGADGEGFGAGEFNVGQTYSGIVGQRYEDGNTNYTDVKDVFIRLGQLCPKDQIGQGDCLPCELEAGCRLEIVLETCLGDQAGEVDFELVDSSNMTLNLLCTQESMDCDVSLESWITLIQSEGPQVDCDDPGLADDSADGSEADATGGEATEDAAESGEPLNEMATAGGSEG